MSDECGSATEREVRGTGAGVAEATVVERATRRARWECQVGVQDDEHGGGEMASASTLWGRGWRLLLPRHRRVKAGGEADMERHEVDADGWAPRGVRDCLRVATSMATPPVPVAAVAQQAVPAPSRPNRAFPPQPPRLSQQRRPPHPLLRSLSLLPVASRLAANCPPLSVRHPHWPSLFAASPRASTRHKTGGTPMGVKKGRRQRGGPSARQEVPRRLFRANSPSRCRGCGRACRRPGAHSPPLPHPTGARLA